MSCTKHGYTNGVFCPACDLEDQAKYNKRGTLTMCNNNPCNCKIDWSKPLKFMNNQSFTVEVLPSKNNIGHHKDTVMVKMVYPPTKEVYYGIFNNVTGKSVSSDSNYDRVENIPEEPRNVVVLVTDGWNGAWRVHTMDASAYKANFTESEANAYRNTILEQGKTGVFVQLVVVPVYK